MECCCFDDGGECIQGIAYLAFDSWREVLPFLSWPSQG